MKLENETNQNQTMSNNHYYSHNQDACSHNSLAKRGEPLI